MWNKWDPSSILYKHEASSSFFFEKALIEKQCPIFYYRVIQAKLWYFHILVKVHYGRLGLINDQITSNELLVTPCSDPMNSVRSNLGFWHSVELLRDWEPLKAVFSKSEMTKLYGKKKICIFIADWFSFRPCFLKDCFKNPNKKLALNSHYYK